MITEHITATTIVKGSARDVCSMCNHYELFPQFIDGISFVSRTDDKTSHWEIKSILGHKINSIAVITEYQEDKRISWESRGKDLNTKGYVTFTSLLNNETEVTIFIEYSHPFGFFGELVLEIFSDPRIKLEEALERFKGYVEGSIHLVYNEVQLVK